MSEYKITMPEGWKPEACAKDCPMMEHGCGEFGKCDCPLSRAVPVKDVEPLEELAKRKGVSFEVCPPSFYAHNVGVWDIGIGEPKKRLYTPFEGPTYKVCEQSARAYLESIEDIK